MKIKSAIISVSNKDGLQVILRELQKYSIKLISSGGTYKKIRSLGYKCTEVSNFTNFPEILDGRVKHFIQKYTLEYCTKEIIFHIKKF